MSRPLRIYINARTYICLWLHEVAALEYFIIPEHLQEIKDVDEFHISRFAGNWGESIPDFYMKIGSMVTNLMTFSVQKYMLFNEIANLLRENTNNGLFPIIFPVVEPLRDEGLGGAEEDAVVAVDVGVELEVVGFGVGIGGVVDDEEGDVGLDVVVGE